MKNQGADIIIMYIHWGTEYQLKHNAYQHGVGQWLADLGIDQITNIQLDHIFKRIHLTVF